MIATKKLKIVTMAAALLAMAGALAPATAAQQRGDGLKNFGDNRARHFNGDNDSRHFNGDRGRHYGNRNHRNRSLRFSVPGFSIYSGESSGCSYSYRKWQASGSRYWRARYYDCRNG